MFWFVGELICPAYHELCSTSVASVLGQCPNSCNLNGDCVDGKCRCLLGYHGHDCRNRKSLVSFASNCNKFQDLNLEVVLFTMQVPALIIAMNMEDAQRKVYAYVKMDLLESTVQRVNY